MKILYIANARIPTEKAHGVQIMEMCKAFAFHNVNVELILPRRINYLKADPFEYYGMQKTFEIKKLPCLDLIILYKYIGHLGLWIESVSFFFSVFFYTLFKKPDIIYTRDKFLLPLSFFKKNIVFEIHTFPKKYFLYSRFLKRPRGILVITQKLKSLFCEQGISPSKILVTPDGVDLEVFDIRETQEDCRKKLHLLLIKKIVIYTGHLYGWKGATVLLQAAKTVPEALFVFVGGIEKDITNFKKQAQGLNNVIIVGQRPHKEIPYWLKAADVLVLPNSGKEEISKHWTSPIKMFEYMGAKRPIVASDLPSIREILNENNAVLVKPDDPDDLTQGIKEVLGNQELADRLVVQAFTDVQNYTWKKRANNILEFIIPHV